MSAKPWENFLASLCFDQPLEPWPSIGISTGKNPISKSAQLHFRMDKLRFANFQKIDVLIPVPHLHSRFGICGIQCYCERSHSFTCVTSCEQHAGHRDTVNVKRWKNIHRALQWTLQLYNAPRSEAQGISHTRKNTHNTNSHPSIQYCYKMQDITWRSLQICAIFVLQKISQIVAKWLYTCSCFALAATLTWVIHGDSREDCGVAWVVIHEGLPETRRMDSVYTSWAKRPFTTEHVSKIAPWEPDVTSTKEFNEGDVGVSGGVQAACPKIWCSTSLAPFSLSDSITLIEGGQDPWFFSPFIPLPGGTLRIVVSNISPPFFARCLYSYCIFLRLRSLSQQITIRPALNLFAATGARLLQPCLGRRSQALNVVRWFATAMNKTAMQHINWNPIPALSIGR